MAGHIEAPWKNLSVSMSDLVRSKPPTDGRTLQRRTPLHSVITGSAKLKKKMLFFCFVRVHIGRIRSTGGFVPFVPTV